MKKAFVTGATGFLGAYLVRYLIKNDYQVFACKRKNSRTQLLGDDLNQITWLEGDILDKKFILSATRHVDVVFHCAALVSFAKEQMAKMMEVNITGTENIVDACIQHKIKMIHSSSIAAIGRPKNQAITITEKQNWLESPYNTAYAKSKYLSEQEVWKGKEKGLNMAIVNPSIILGAGYWDNGRCKLCETIRKGLKFYPIGSTGFVDVRDVSISMLNLAESEIKHQRFIINGHNASYRELFNLMAKHLNVSKPNIKVNTIIRDLAWRFEAIRCKLTNKHPFITRESAMISSLSYRYDNEKSLKSLGLEYHNFEDTISSSCLLLSKFKQDGTYLKMSFES